MTNKTRLTLALSLILASLLAACQSSNQPAENSTSSTETAGGAAGGATGATKGGGTAKRAARAEPAEEKVAVPAGTAVSIRLGSAISSGQVSSGAGFEGTLAEPLVVNGIEVAATGSAVAGKVTNAVSSGRLNRPAELSLTLASLTPTGGKETEIATDTWGEKGESHKKRNIEMIGGGAGVGALVGALAGGKKGAAIGGAVGAGAGTGTAAATGKKEIVLPAGDQIGLSPQPARDIYGQEEVSTVQPAQTSKRRTCRNVKVLLPPWSASRE